LNTYLGVDGGGSKTDFLLIDAAGTILARHQEGPAYYLEVGLDALRALLARGIRATATQAAIAAPDFAFFGIPAYGEDSGLRATLDELPCPPLARTQVRCGNDMVCGWAGALAGADGINIVAGTGSIAYGEYEGRQARAGGWGELFSDEGSAYWIAREGLALFSRMSDGRAARGPLHAILRAHYGIEVDLDICAAVFGADPARSRLAALAPVIAGAARAGDREALGIFSRAAGELAQIVVATRRNLHVPDGVRMNISYSGGMFRLADLILDPLRACLEQSRGDWEFVAPRLAPSAGAALYAAKCHGTPLDESAIAELERSYSRLAA
jgi:N-acetylglucosamine kinase-like BadF-type ATPase